jgi:amino acid adenylation domain-containing protein
MGDILQNPVPETHSDLLSDHPGDGIMEWLATAFARHGNQTAVECGERKLSYCETDAWSNELADASRKAGLFPGAIVVTLIRDRMEMVVALLGILKAGCVFVPLDPDLPRNRLTDIMMDLGPDGCLVEPGSDPISFPDRLALKLVEVEGNGRYRSFLKPEATCQTGSDNGIPNGKLLSDPDAMRYICYTSGSTGRAKGIAGRLKGVSHFVRWEIETFSIKSGWRFSQLTSPTFDAYFRDVFVPLCSGGTICIPSGDAAKLEPNALTEWINARQINLIHCVPSVFSLILEGRAHANWFLSLKWILLAGEVLSVANVKRWMDLYEDRIKLVNLYGPSETTMVKFFHIVSRSDVKRGFVPIGMPIKGARALILDEQGQVCPPGVMGEIYIRTPYRTLGYYKDQPATNRAFIQNPFTKNPDDLIYKTGDLGMILKDGNFRFCGRKDNQVKIRGIRVELEEIETMLLTHEAVGAAIVLLRDDGESSARLIGYVAPKKEALVSTDQLRTYLQAKLPEYMVPNTFVILASLPLTPNGKVDRKALPAPKRRQEEGVFMAPRTPTEELLVGIYKKVLKVDRVGVNENFFELGGHSLLATQVISRVRKVFEVELPLKSMFESPTVAGLGERVETLRGSEVGLVMLPEIRRMERDRPLPLSYLQEYSWNRCHLQSDWANVPMSQVLPIGGSLQVKALERAINEMIRRHKILRTTYKNSEAGPVQVIQDHQYRELPVVDLEGLMERPREEELRRLILEAVQRPFDLERGPVLRTALVRLGVDRHIFLAQVHHIAGDFYSSEIWNRETRVLYDAFSKGQESPLAELPIQYADYAVWQRSLLQGEVFEKHVEYWRKQLAGMCGLCLPTDYPRPEEPTIRRTEEQLMQIRPALVEELKKLQQEGVTLHTALVAGIMVVINRYGGHEDITITTLIATRNRMETEGLIGFFATGQFFRLNLKGDPTLAELLGRVKKTALGAYAHQDLPQFVSGLVDPQEFWKHYGGGKNIKLRLVKYIMRELLKTITLRSLKIITRELLKTTTFRSLKIIMRGLLKNPPLQLLKILTRESLGNITLEWLLILFSAGRSREELDAWARLGMLLVELRPDLARGILGNPMLSGLLNSMMQCSAAYGRQVFYYGELMEKAQLGRDIGRNRAHVSLGFVPVPYFIDGEGGLNGKGSKWDSLPKSMGRVTDVSLSIRESNLGLGIRAVYDPDLFKLETMQRIVKDLEEVLEEFVRNPAKRLSELNVGKSIAVFFPHASKRPDFTS